MAAAAGVSAAKSLTSVGGFRMRINSSPLTLLLILCLAGPPIPVLAQSSRQQEEKSGETIRIQSNLVNVYVRVADRDGKPASGLRREDFHLFEDGVEQTIEHFGPAEDPFTIALVINVTGQMDSRMREVREAASAFVDLMRPSDRAMVITFDPFETLLAEATSDKEKLKKAIGKIKPRNTVNLYQGFLSFFLGRFRWLVGRKAMLLFSDGIDHNSFYGSYEDNVLAAETGGALIYPIQYDSLDRDNPKLAKDAIAQHKLAAADAFLRDVAEKSGGRFLRAEKNEALKDSFESIARELRQQYSLGYYPKTQPAPGERRIISVRFEQKNLVAITRSYNSLNQTAGNSEQSNHALRQSTSSGSNAEEKRRWQDVPSEYFGDRVEAPGVNMCGPYAISFFSGEIEARLTNLVIEDSKNQDAISALIHIDPRNLTFIEEADGWQSAVAYVFAASYFHAGSIDGASTATVKFRERGERLSELMKNGRSVNINIPLLWHADSSMWPAVHSTRQVRAIIRDAKSSKTTYLSQFVSIAPRNSFLHMSGVLLSAEPTLSVERMLTSFDGFDTGSAQPSPAARRFRRGTTINYSYYVYDAKPYNSDGRKRIVEQTHLEHQNSNPVRVAFDELDMSEQKDKKRLLVKGSLKLGPDMRAGWYVLRIALSDERPAKEGFMPKAVQWIDFQVIE